MSMKLSEETKEILKNFADINNSILIRPGQEIGTISTTNNVFATAKVSETFPEKFAIYDLGEFLNGLDLFEDCELEFGNSQYVTIKNNHTKIKYFYSDPDLVVTPPQKKINFDSQFSFQLTTEMLKSLKKGAAVFSLPDLCLKSEGSEVHLVVVDIDNVTSNTMSYIVGHSDTPIDFKFKMENIKVISGNYTVHVAIFNDKGQGAAHFIEDSMDLEYFIALEPERN